MGGDMVDWFGRASLVLVSVAFMLSLVMLVLWQVRMIYRFGRQLDEERRMKRYNRLLPWSDSYVPPPFDRN
jgi:amino acid transporter